MKKTLRFLSYVLVAALASCLTLVLFTQNDAAQPQSKLDQLSALIQERLSGRQM